MNIKYLKNITNIFYINYKIILIMFFYVKANALNIPPDDYDRKIQS